MKPTKLELEGFTGIIKGLGRNKLVLDLTLIPDDKKLVTFVGPNGSAKSTVLDNLHPYRVMPSRSTTLGPGGFSYWDEISGQTASKVLFWEHGPRKFQSQFYFSSTAKTKKADYYLYEWEAGLSDWVPAKTADGVKSDGKADVYDQCVESVLGIPERFFTSQFAAQQRPALSSYRPGEIKSLLASILNLTLFNRLSAKAAAVAKLLRHQLDSLNDELSTSRGAETSIAEVQRKIELQEVHSKQCAERLVLAEQALSDARLKSSRLDEMKLAEVKVTEEINFLRGQIEKVQANHAAAQSKLTQQAAADESHNRAQIERITNEINNSETEIRKIDREIGRLQQLIAQKAEIKSAEETVAQARAQILQIDERVSRERAKLAALVPYRLELDALVVKMTEVGTLGKANANKIIELKNVASLTEQVPCSGSGMQKSCQLLAQSNNANALIPTKEAEVASQRVQYGLMQNTVKELKAKVATAIDIEAVIEVLVASRNTLSEQAERAAMLASHAGFVTQAEEHLPGNFEAKDAHLRIIEQGKRDREVCSVAITSISRTLRQDVQECSDKAQVEVTSFSDRLAQLGKTCDETEVIAARQAVQTARQRVDAEKTQAMTLSEEKIALLSSIEVLKNIVERTKESKAQAERLQDEIAKWKLIEKGMGNDGMIALAIDDAGPAIASLCNQLLSDDNVGRFKVRIDTQREAQNGNVREAFDIMVYDNRGGDETRIGSMSGGEKVWVNECLTRAIALHISQTGAMGYQTLFTDEADGAFDPARKRQFMQIKRLVLERGGYEREYFISQTPELWELADHIIYMDQL